MKSLYALIGILLLALALSAQRVGADVRLSFAYRQVPLWRVIEDLEASYGLRFVYSSSFVPLDFPISVRVREKPLARALDQLFAEAPIRHAIIGGQIALRYDPGKLRQREEQTLFSRREPAPPPPEAPPTVAPEPAPPARELPPPPATPISSPPPRQLPGGDALLLTQIDLEPLFANLFANRPLPPTRTGPNRRLAQVSLLPTVSSNYRHSSATVNNISLNLIAGVSGGVAGLEIGGLYNEVRGHVVGYQVAGGGNKVGGDVVGSQMAGIGNWNGGLMKGVQVGGLFNYSRGRIEGVQAAGLLNIAQQGSDAVQLAGVGNATAATARTQIAGLFNRAGDVKTGQISALLNRGRNVYGYQFGLINISDTISGAPIGLLNIVRKGYNKVEVGTGDALWLNLGFKVGAPQFYNIFQFGARWDELTRQRDGQHISGRFMTWALGYGFGTAKRLNRSLLANSELVVLHLNEYENWTETLNLLGQLRLTFDLRLGRYASCYAGPVLHVSASRLYDPATATYGTHLAGKSFFDEQYDDLNVRAWLGFTAGMRL